MKINIIKIDTYKDMRGLSRANLEVRVGDIPVGRIQGGQVIQTGGNTIQGRSLVERLQKLASCSEEDALAALHSYSEQIG